MNPQAQSGRQFEPDPVIEAYKRDVDRTLLRENLRLTPQQRFDKFRALQQFAAELRRAGRAAQGSQSPGGTGHSS